MGEQNQTFYEFGPFCVDTRERVLLRDGRPLQLKPKVYETLLALISQSGHVVDKEELMKRVWPDVVVEENNLTGNIFALRRAFDGYECIETVPRRGYRFTADVKLVRVADGKLVNRSGAETEVVIKEPVDRRGAAIDSLAVLPFVNASADPETEYLSDGITESIINSLTQLTTLRVAARNTVFRYKGRELDAQQIGHELKVGAVLTGRILQFRDRLIVRTELVDIAAGWQLWGAQFDREPSDILAVQIEIAREISDGLRLKLTGKDRQLLEKRHTESIEAYHAYLNGRYHWNKRTDEGLKLGIEHFQKAIDIDPVYALAYTGLADCYAVLGTFGGSEPRAAFPKAKAATARALEIDNGLAEAHTSSAFVKQLYNWDWRGAAADYARAIDLNPGYSTTYFWRATLFAALGQREESITEISHALELDPLSLPINTYLGWAYYFARRYDQAITQYLKTLELDHNFIQAKWRLGLAFAALGMFEAAIQGLREALALSPDNPLILGALGYVYALAGQPDKAHQILDELEKHSSRHYVSSYHLATIYTGLGENDEALRWLEQAFDERAGLLIYLNVEPVFDNLRADSRFADLGQRIGLQQNRTADQ